MFISYCHYMYSSWMWNCCHLLRQISTIAGSLVKLSSHVWKQTKLGIIVVTDLLHFVIYCVGYEV